MNLEALRCFIEREALLLDHGRYDEWLTLFSDDCLYWAPFDESARDPDNELNLLYHRRDLLAMRVRRFATGTSVALAERPHLVRVISGVHLIDNTETSVVVGSSFMLSALRGEHQRVLAGRLRHRIKVDGRAMLIEEKRVDLQGTRTALNDFSYLL